MQRLALFTLLILILFSSKADAQQRRQQRFTAGALLGINASQLDGDDQSGYSKNGIVGGLRGIARLTPRFDLNVELLYTQRGSKPSANGNNGERPVTIALNYAETPFLITFKTAENWDGHYRLQLSTGLSYARLLNSKVKETSGSTPNIAGMEDKFQKNDISWKAGLAYLITSKLSLGVRHTFSFTPLLKEIPASSESGKSLRSYYLNLHLAYTL